MSNEWLIRNLDAVRSGAMVRDPGADTPLLAAGLIRRNSPDWYDLTDKGRVMLDDLRAQAAA